MDPRLWVYLHNLLSSYPPRTDLTEEQFVWAASAARSKGFVCDEPKPDRLTRKGEIALKLDSGKA